MVTFSSFDCGILMVQRCKFSGEPICQILEEQTLPQGKVEAARRAKAMVAKMDELGFGNCTNTRACEMECPKNISVSNIARLNREFICAKLQD